MAAPTGLYGWIESNRGRSWQLFIVFLLIMQVAGMLTAFLPLVMFDPAHAPFLNWGGYWGRYAPLVLIGSILWFAKSYWYEMEKVRRAVGFHFVDNHEEPRLCHVLEALLTDPAVRYAGIKTPYVGVIETKARNAFACGIGRKKVAIVVTRGLLDTLDDDELANVLAHELCHIKNGDIQLMAAANIFLRALTGMSRNNPLQFTPVHVVAAILIPALLPLTLIGGFLGHMAIRLAQASRLVIGNAREFLADAEAVQYTKNPAALASALVKVGTLHSVPGSRAGDDGMMIVGDSEGEYATHPTITHRISALARTTGAMAYNARAEHSAPAWHNAALARAAEQAATLGKAPDLANLKRVQSGSRKNWLGLDFPQMAMAGFTILFLGVLHMDDWRNPSAFTAKFDPQPLGIVFMGATPCLKAMEQSCQPDDIDEMLEKAKGQDYTLVGYLANRNTNGESVAKTFGK